MAKKKLTRNERAKIRYQLYRDAGYSVQEARVLRHYAYIDISGIKIDRNTRKVIKKRNYQNVKGAVVIDNTMTRMRRIENTSVFTQHGFLLSNSETKGEYNEVVRKIKMRDKMTTNQAYYFAHYMLSSGYSYEFTRRELLSSQEFEKYEKNKKSRVRK